MSIITPPAKFERLLCRAREIAIPAEPIRARSEAELMPTRSAAANIRSPNSTTLMQELRKRFQSVKVHSPDASRDTSSEVYVICQGYYGKSGITLKKPDVEEKKPEFTVKGGFI